jgi:hypothetical protein
MRHVVVSDRFRRIVHKVDSSPQTIPVPPYGGWDWDTSGCPGAINGEPGCVPEPMLKPGNQSHLTTADREEDKTKVLA